MRRVAKKRIICSFSYEAEAVSAAVGLSGNHAYRKSDYTSYRDALGWLLKERIGGTWNTRRYTFGLQVKFYLGNKRKIDLDNLLKPVMDAGTHILWADDSQVAELSALKVLNDPNPRIEVTVYHVGDFIDYHHTCAYCGRDMAGLKELRRKYCTKYCADQAMQKGTTKVCEYCGNQFYIGRRNGKRKLARKYCNRECYNKWVKAHGHQMVERIRRGRR